MIQLPMERPTEDTTPAEAAMIAEFEALREELRELRNAVLTKNRLLRAFEDLSWRFWFGCPAPTEEGPDETDGAAAAGASR